VSLKHVVAALLFLLTLSPAWAVEPDEVLADPGLEARARHLTQELRCVVCQNQSVDDSDAPLARDIRVLVRERIKAGDTDAEARDFIVARYGKFVLLRPRLDAGTILLWFGPLAFLLLAGTWAWSYVRNLNRRSSRTTPLDADEEAIVQRKLNERAP
jgi:cytochrome c-type biogenesis protein CcmH